MATTTNYSWTTPDDTDLVKDGASAIRSLGSAIDSTVFTNAGNAVQKSTIDAKGDLLVGTADNTITRLAVGTNNYVLTADSAETSGIKWAAAAGGANWTLLNSGGTALTGATSITVSGISGKDKIMMVIRSASSASAQSYISVRLNSDTSTIYEQAGLFLDSSSVWSYSLMNGYDATDNKILIGRTSTNEVSAVDGGITFSGCNSSGVKTFQSCGGVAPGGAAGGEHFIFQGQYGGSSTISSISLISSLGNFDAGTIYVYASA